MTVYSTPPWRACHNGECSCGLIWSVGDDEPIARVMCRNELEFRDYSLVRVRANARLFAAAPEMYELLLDAPRPQGDDRAWQRCRLALLARIDGTVPEPPTEGPFLPLEVPK
jgi:hypothetical protein